MATTDPITMEKMLKTAKLFHEAGNKFIGECQKVSIEAELPYFIIKTLLEFEVDALAKSFGRAKREADAV